MTPKCACTGIRHCLLCQNNLYQQPSGIKKTWFCPNCNGIFSGSVQSRMSSSFENSCTFHTKMKLFDTQVKGIRVFLDFITKDEEEFLLGEINKEEWKMSQSGRRKQDFGPKANFKRKKLKLGTFNGLPSYSKSLVERFKFYLPRFHPVELCNLEYTPERGSSIDPHIDDTWLWGDQLVTVNLCAATILTLSEESNAKLEIQIPMPGRSLVVIENEARYKWLHGVRAEDILAKRIAMTFRNLSDEVEGSLMAEEIKTVARSFVGIVVQ